jgi:hypothetical protein
MIVEIFFENSELDQRIYKRVHQAADECRPGAAAIAGDHIAIPSERMHLISPLRVGQPNSQIGFDWQHLRIGLGCGSGRGGLAIIPARNAMSSRATV